jgi:hypothetical protein
MKDRIRSAILQAADIADFGTLPSYARHLIGLEDPSIMEVGSAQPFSKKS